MLDRRYFPVPLALLLAASQCGGAVAPSTFEPLTTLTIEASDSCQIGPGGLPFKTYAITMKDQRSPGELLFLENRDVGPREQALVLRLQPTSNTVTGKLTGPAIITTPAGRMTVFPDGDVTATAAATLLTGSWSGSLVAFLTDGSGPFASCTADDHRITMPLPPSK